MDTMQPFYIDQQIKYWRMMAERFPHPFYEMNVRTYEQLKADLIGHAVKEREEGE